ncbi:MAG: TetR/AcrR family transcriptional regulator [Bacteroidetes bacterium]|nr:TetR/AcrR family transcriptional regulator [Bacteroidota bacterium]
MAPKIVDRYQKKVEIGLVALDYFSKNGFSSTSISQIAAAAGIGKGSVYDYFKSKEDLIGFSLELYVKRIEEKVGHILLDITDPKDQMKRYVSNVMDTFMKDPQSLGVLLSIIRMIITDTKKGDKQNILNDMFLSTRQTIISILKKGIDEKVFRSEIENEIEIIAINLIAYIDGIWLHYLLDPKGIDLKAQVNNHLEKLFCILDPV